jgi:hypothetical protein
MQAKKFITMYDTIRNTGMWKTVLLELSLSVIMPYPFFNDYYYYETYTNKTGDYHIEY